MKNFAFFSKANAVMAEMSRAFLRVVATRRNVRHNYVAFDEWMRTNGILPTDLNVVMVQSAEALRHLINSLLRSNPTLTLNNVVFDGHHSRTRFVVIDGTSVYGYPTYRKFLYEWGDFEVLSSLLKKVLVTGDTISLVDDGELAEHGDWNRIKFSMFNAIERVGADLTTSTEESEEECNDEAETEEPREAEGIVGVVILS